MSSQRLSGGYISLLLPAGRGEEKRGGEWRIDLSWRKKKFFFEEREDGGKRAECEHFFPLSRRKIYSSARRECSSFLSSLNRAEENMAGWIRPGNETTMHFLCCPLSPQVALPCMAGYLPSKRKKTFRAAVSRMSKRERDSRHFALLLP